MRTELSAQWERDEHGFSEQAERRARRVTAKAWRFAGEMDEIASTFEFASLPGGFHAAAEQIYRKLSSFKDAGSLPELEDIWLALLER